ncbi:hypothetical protein ACFYWN_12105 [Streptomyces sp. NPDC002917]|uniref:hypothetical protein n=1 Tax=Streptomyces sp. NPDC002917 TaxID=3364671 RepID=UPI00367D19BB
MTTIPAALSKEQARAVFSTVFRTLGFPPSLVHSVHLDVDDGVRALLYVRDREGRRINHGDDVLTTTIHIPFEEASSRGTA